MSIFKDSFKELKKADLPLYKTPKSIQETIEILKISEDGIFEVAPGKFSKCYVFQDINYQTKSEVEQMVIFEKYCRLLNSFDCSFKITINNKNRDLERFEREVLFPYTGDAYDGIRGVYNGIIEDKIVGTRQGIDQEKYLTVTVARKSCDEARAHFRTIEATLGRTFTELGSLVKSLNANERIRILHDFYHMGNETTFSFDIKNHKKLGLDYRNDLANTKLIYKEDHIEDEKKFTRALFIKSYPRGISDAFLSELASLPVHSIISVDAVPVPKEMTQKVLDRKYMGIESDIIKQQRVRNRNNDFSSDISYAKRNEKKEIEAIMDDVRDNDQCLFFAAVTILVMAENKAELDRITEMVQSVGKGHGVVIETHLLKQREALNTAIPLGVRQVETMRTMLTQSLAVLMPFNVQELTDIGGNYYGVNQISKNVNVGNRKKLINGNGFVFGVPGSGKSFFCKMEMGSVFLKTNDDIIIIDPQNEYFDVARTYGGAVVNLSSFTANYVNPMALDVNLLDMTDSHGLIRQKFEFMMGLIEQCTGGEVGARHRTVIDRCIRTLYFGIAGQTERYVPTMTDFYNELLRDGSPEAMELAMALEIFVNGSLNIFNNHTNVDMNNRLTVYGIRDLGSELSPIAMLVMLETIRQRILSNSMRGVATWLYIDEMHVLLNSENSAYYLQELWKTVRKQGGLCTGMTQNITDLLQNYIATTMISNSEFIVMLKQSNPDSMRIADVIGISPAELKYVANSQAGMGLIKCGNVVVPFDNQVEKGNWLYELYNTNMHEKVSGNNG